jgi:hypothetical protein
MKSIIAMVLSVILSTFTMSLFAGEDYYFARDDEELYGTWINLHYGTNPGRWKDSQGNIMYKIHWVGSWGKAGYSLCRISNSGKTLEYMNSHNDYPKEIDPNSSYYRKYNRK